ncbi:hypothetical protein [Streptomyces sp. NPDC001404]|uniref:hypothetical protein n=1 Tax=Streptomyces sp. NPDC001404 TaxID=3364571 RepID=UPI0036C985EC
MTLQQRLHESVRYVAEKPPKAPVKQHPEHTEESLAGAHYRHAHGDTAIWPAHDFEVYWDLARAVPFPDLGPGQTR